MPSHSILGIMLSIKDMTVYKTNEVLVLTEFIVFWGI